MDFDECERWECGHVAANPRPDGPPGFRCPQCRKVSWNLNDLRHGWCDRCKAFTTQPHGPADPPESAP